MSTAVKVAVILFIGLAFAGVSSAQQPQSLDEMAVAAQYRCHQDSQFLQSAAILRASGVSHDDAMFYFDIEVQVTRYIHEYNQKDFNEADHRDYYGSMMDDIYNLPDAQFDDDKFLAGWARERYDECMAELTQSIEDDAAEDSSNINRMFGD